MLQIVEVQYQSEQGRSGPYVCKAEDGHRYYVKGRYSGRRSQVCELLGWHLASAFGLPVPPGAMLELSEELFEELPRNLRGIGKGVLFGLQEAQSVRWFEQADAGWVSQSFRRDLLVFDYWVSNEDRCIYNSNLLLRDTDKQVVVIDHNRIFITGEPREELIGSRVFADEWSFLSGDLAAQAEYSARLEGALRVWPDACNNLPLEWNWENDELDVPVDFDIHSAYESLLRFSHVDFWEAI